MRLVIEHSSDRGGYYYLDVAEELVTDVEIAHHFGLTTIEFTEVLRQHGIMTWEEDYECYLTNNPTSFTFGFPNKKAAKAALKTLEPYLIMRRLTQ
jgi:hypothetical protein